MKKNIINVPEPNPRLNLFIFEKLILHVVHKSTLYVQAYGGGNFVPKVFQIFDVSNLS